MSAARPLVCLLLAGLLAPAAAQAGTVTVAGGTVTFTAGAVESNAVVVTQPGGAGAVFEIRDSRTPPVDGSDACEQAAADLVTCSADGINAVEVLLGDLDDSGSTGALAVPVTVDGGDDDDDLAGGGGRDRLLGGRGEDSLTGGAGDDVLDAGRGDDDVQGGAGADVVAGGTGDDVVEGGSGPDQLDAGAGSDVIRARDGETDSVVCGPETDHATVDFPDTTAADCETVDRAPDPNPPAPTPTPAATPTPTRTAVSSPPVMRDRTAPVILVSRRSVRVDRKGRFRVVLVSANEAAVGSIVADTDSSPRVRLGRAVFVLRVGVRSPVRIALTAAGRRALRRARGRSIPMRVRVQARDAAGNSVQVSARLRVKQP